LNGRGRADISRPRLFGKDPMIAISPAAGAPASSPDKSKAAILVGRCDVRLWGLTPYERCRRALARCGIDDIGIDGAPPPDAASFLLLRTDFVIDEILIEALAATPDTLLMPALHDGRRTAVAAHVAGAPTPELAALLRRETATAAEAAAFGLELVGPAELGGTYNQALQKQAVPYVLPLVDQPARAVERQMFDAASEGITDFVTKWLWPWPAFWASRWFAARRVAPIFVTVASLLLVLLAILLFEARLFGMGLVAAWLMAFFDSVDGRLALVTVATSRIGRILHDGIHLLHPPLWYLAWFYGLASASAPGQTLLLAGSAWVCIVGYVIARLLEGVFRWRFGFSMQAWRRLDSVFRLFAAGGNPNLVLLTLCTLSGRPDNGLHAVAAWTLLSLAFHVVRTGQAFRRRRAGLPVESWRAAA
jgi:phosphatidylglycerophosphate synthase